MIKKFLLSLLLIGLVAMSVSFGTYAWFNSRTSSVDNVFETGELIIGVPYEGKNDGFINAQNLIPGKSISDTVKIRNLGDIKFKYKVRSSFTQGDKKFFNKLNLKINKDSQNIYNGKLKDLNTKIGEILPENSENLEFTISLPTDANNYYQGKIALVKFTFDSTQVANNEWKQ